MIKKIYYMIIPAVFMFVVLMSYISLLGENSKIDEFATIFFEGVIENEYQKSYKLLNSSYSNNYYNDFSKFESDLLILNLSLSEYYNISQNDEYSFKFKRSSMWIPYLTDDNISVAVSIIKKDKLFSVKKIFTEKSINYVDNVVTFKIEKGSWRIISINLENLPYLENVEESISKFENKNYFNVMKNGFEWKGFVYDRNKTTSTEKRILKHFLKKAIRLIDKEIAS